MCRVRWSRPIKAQDSSHLATLLRQYFAVFLRRLVTHLDQTKPDWRKTHILLLDNSPIHTSDHVVRLLSYLKVPTMFTAPASNRALPVEHVFGILKSQDVDIDKPDGAVDSETRKTTNKSKKSERFINELTGVIHQLDRSMLQRLYPKTFGNLK